MEWEAHYRGQFKPKYKCGLLVSDILEKIFDIVRGEGYQNLGILELVKKCHDLVSSSQI